VANEDDLRLRHLDIIQATIARLAQHSFTVRGWSATVSAAVFAVLGASGADSATILVALAPIVVFWGLDAYYLRRERLFRHLFAAAGRRLHAGAGAPDVSPFDMDVTPYAGRVPGFVRTLVSPTVAAVPAVLAAVVVVFALATG
jgi:hypothetical protein